MVQIINEVSLNFGFVNYDFKIFGMRLHKEIIIYLLEMMLH